MGDNDKENLQFLHVLRFQPLRALDRFKADTVVLGKSLKAFSQNCLMVHKHVRAIILGYKPVALLVIKPFYGTFCQSVSPPS